MRPLLLICVFFLGALSNQRPLLSQGIASGALKPAGGTSASNKPFPVQLKDVSLAAGITAKITYGNEAVKKYIVEANGSGIGFFDADDDGLPDVLLLNGSRLPAPTPKPSNVLYRNLGNGKFQDVTRAAGLERSGWANGVCAADFDNDGRTDFYVTYWGKNVLYRGLPEGRFEDATGKAGVGGIESQWATGCTFLDFDRDGFADLLFATYLEFTPGKVPSPGAMPNCLWKGAPVFCGPRGLPHGRLTLFRNKGDGTFEDVSQQAGVRNVSGCYAFTTVAADIDGDGWTDVYVACDSTPSLLLRNGRNGTFREIGTESGLAFNENGSEQAGMGIAIGDYDGDGLLDISKTNFSGDYPNLYRNAGRGIFTDVPVRAGIAVNPRLVQWGTGFVDFDLDGWLDLFQVSGHVYPDVKNIDAADSYAQPPVVYRNLGNGRFEDMSAKAGVGALEARSSRGAAFADFDSDGAVDIAVMNMHARPALLRNTVNAKGTWLKVRLEGVKSNRAAIGAVVTVEAGGRKQVAPVVSQSSFLSVSDFTLHFGLGGAGRADGITVRWPSGEMEQFDGASAGQIVKLREGSGRKP